MSDLPPPVPAPAPTASFQRPPRLASEDVVIQSPTSFVGSAARIWKLTRLGPPWAKWLTIPAAVMLIAVAWIFCALWLVVFGILLVPWRLIRRGQRKRKLEERRHREMLAAQQRS